MRILTLIITLSLSLVANEYFAKLQPLETYNIKASVSGQITYVNNDINGLKANNSIIVELDSKVDKIELKQTNSKIKTFKEIIKLERSTLKKFQRIKSKSQMDRDNQKIKVLNLENQLLDLVTKKAMLDDKVSKKKLTETNRYISNINVKVGDFVNAGTLLYTAEDLSKGKVEIFLPIDTAMEQESKVIFINGEVTSYKISKLYQVADTVHISSYKCEIILDAPKNFSKLVKIEFK